MKLTIKDIYKVPKKYQNVILGFHKYEITLNKVDYKFFSYKKALKFIEEHNKKLCSVCEKLKPLFWNLPEKPLCKECLTIEFVRIRQVQNSVRNFVGAKNG